MKKLVSVVLALILSLSVFASAFSANAVFASQDVVEKLNSNVYYLVSLDEDTVFFQKNADKKVPVAGFIKLIAAAVAIEKWGNLDELVTVTDKNRSLVKYDYGVRTAGYKTGEKISKKELINCLIIYSANDAASIIAYEVSGSLDGFIGEMQALMTKLGCKDTVIKNIHGFDEEGQYTTAKDLCTFIKHAITFPVFSDAFSATNYVIPAYDDREEKTVTSGNKMMSSSIADYYHKSVTGGKYTMTDEAGECVAAVSNMDGYSYLTIVLGGKLMNVDSDSAKENTSFNDAQKMLNWVYENIRYRVVVSPEQSITVIDVDAGKDTDKLRLIPEKETSALVPSKVNTASVSFEIVPGSVPKKVTAPVKAGEIMGQAKVYYAGEEITTINLVASQDIQRSAIGFVMGIISNIVGSKLFLVLSILVFLACAAYLAYMLCKFFGIIDDKNLKPLQRKKKAVKKPTKRPANNPQRQRKPSTGKPMNKNAQNKKMSGKDKK